MKKIFLMLLAMMLAMTTLTAFAEEGAVIPSPDADAMGNVALLEGFVLDVQPDMLTVLTKDGMTVEVHLTAETITEGKDIAIGDYLHIAYNGMMTRSLPPQITADHIGNYMLMGIVSDLTENGFTLTFGEDVYAVNAEASQLEGISEGMFITLYHTGMMTLSIPAQVSASHIRGTEIIGTVTEMVEGGFTLTVEGEEIPYHVAIKENAIQFVQAEPGMEVLVITDGLATASLESILVNATEILPMNTAAELYVLSGTVTEMGEGFLLIDTAEGQLQVNTGDETLFEGKETLTLGDFIHVTHNGQMTMSIPAQIFAQKVGCYMHVGTITEITEGQFALETEEGIILVNTADLEGLEVGMNVYVYSDGAMTMSLPAQIGANLVVIRSR